MSAAAEAVAPALDVFERPDIGSSARAPVPFAADLPGGNPLRRVAEGFARIGADNEAAAAQMAPQAEGIVMRGLQSGYQSLGQNLLMLPMAFVPGGQPAYLTAMSSNQGGQSYLTARAKALRTL